MVERSQLVLNWKHIFVDACITQSILVCLEIATIIRTHLTRSIPLVTLLTSLLLVSSITWPVCTYLLWQYYIEADLTLSCHMQVSERAKNLCLWYSMISMANIISFNACFWIFAMRYWILARALDTDKRIGGTKKIKRFYNSIFWTGCLLIVGLSFIFVMLSYYDAAPKFNQAILPILYITSTIFLATGLRKIKEVMSTISNEIVSERHFVLHFATFALFLLGQVPNIILGIILGYSYQFKKSFQAVAIINNLTASLSEVCLLIIFNELCSNAVMPRTITQSSDGQTPTEMSLERDQQQMLERMRIQEMKIQAASQEQILLFAEGESGTSINIDHPVSSQLEAV